MGYNWKIEEDTKPNVRKAAEIARTARECLKKAYDLPPEKAEKELIKVIALIKEIDHLLELESDYYCSQFFRYFRPDDCMSLNVDAYYRAMLIARKLKKYDFAIGYAERCQVLAKRSSNEDDAFLVEDCQNFIKYTREEMIKNSPQYKAAEKVKKKKENITKLFTVCFWLFRIAFIVGTVLGGGMATSESLFSMARIWYLLIIGAMAFFCMLSSKEGDTWPRPLILAPFGMTLISIMYYIFGHGYKQNNFSFVLLQFVIAALVVVISAGIGLLISKARGADG